MEMLGVVLPQTIEHFVLLVVLTAGCAAAHSVDAAPDATFDGGFGPDVGLDGAALRPDAAPIDSVCGPSETCADARNERLPDVDTGRFIAWLPETDTYLLRSEAEGAFELRRGGVVRTFAGYPVAALETDESVVLNIAAGGEHHITVLARDSLDVIVRFDSPSLGLATVERGFGSIRVEHRGDDDFYLWWDVFDALGNRLSTSGFARPPGGWSSMPRFTYLSGALVLGWVDPEGCARALWVRDGAIQSETILYCAEQAGCQAEPVVWTGERDGRVGFAVRVYCGDAPNYLVGTLDGPASAPTLLDICASRAPVLSLEPAGGLRAIITRSFSVYDLRVGADPQSHEMHRLAQGATALAAMPDGGVLYGTIDGDVFVGRCAL